ncbi:outer membrane beta-barrel protein [Altererythrobacter sp.]|uniref:outer membrane beta-barrel protein n=1 Tax=Altererythrobacter sp. TaxID=1872480 RepID=UPI003D01CB0D
MAIQRRRTVHCVATILAVSLPMPAAAQSLDDDFWIEAGVYFPKLDTDISATSKEYDFIGTEIDLEKDLGLKTSSNLITATAGARLSNSISLVADYYKIGRKGEIGIARELIYDDVTYPVAASLKTTFDSDIYRLTLNYSFIRNDALEIGIGGGAHVTDFSVQLSGEGRVGNESLVQFETRKEKLTAPLPTIGVYAAGKITPRLTLGARAEYLSLKVGDYKGRLANTQVALTYRLFDHVGLGIAFRRVDYRLKIDKRDWFGRYDYRFNGPEIFLKAGF